MIDHQLGKLYHIYCKDGGITKDTGLLVDIKQSIGSGHEYTFLVDGYLKKYNSFDFFFRVIE